MAIIPIEVVTIGDVDRLLVSDTLQLANSVQSSFHYSELETSERQRFELLSYPDLLTKTFFKQVEKIKNNIRGYHPFIIVYTDAELRNGYYKNLFGDMNEERTIAIVTIDDVVDNIIPKEKIQSYILYYLGRYTFSFIVPELKNHSTEESKNCVFDPKIQKTDILNSMKARAICNDCRNELFDNPSSMNSAQFNALNNLFHYSGEVLEKGFTSARTRMFFGSSDEVVEMSRKIQKLLNHNYALDIWNGESLRKEGKSFFDSITEQKDDYDYGLFVFSPQDKTHIQDLNRLTAKQEFITPEQAVELVEILGKGELENTEELIGKMKALIGNNEVGNAIDIMLRMYKGNKDILNQLILLRQQWVRNQKNDNLGLKKDETIDTNYSRIANSLLEILDSKHK